MFNSDHKVTRLLFLLLSAAIATTTIAAPLPGGYPQIKEFQNLGSIGSIEKFGGKIVVNDQEYNLPKSVVVYASGGKLGTLRDLRTGKSVGLFSDSGSDESFPRVSEIWIFPRGYKIDVDSFNPKED